jgi:mannosyl-oligosaccharide alpha-1,2-mannosidase
MYVYDTSRFAKYKDRWIKAADSTIKHLASHPSSRPDLTYLAQYSNRTLQFDSGHLACFDGGNFILGGLVLNEQRYIDFGLQLVNACENTYNQTLTGIGPEGFSWNTSSIPADQQAFYDRAGFYITNGNYILRPEVIESFYYAYRATGARVYQDVSEDMNADSDTLAVANVIIVGLVSVHRDQRNLQSRIRILRDPRRECTKWRRLR